MTIWILNTIGLLATTIGSLIVLLHLHRTARAAEFAKLRVECAPLLKDRRMLTITMGLIAAWFVVQSAAVILI